MKLYNHLFILNVFLCENLWSRHGIVSQRFEVTNRAYKAVRKQGIRSVCFCSFLGNILIRCYFKINIQWMPLRMDRCCEALQCSLQARVTILDKISGFFQGEQTLSRFYETVGCWCDAIAKLYKLCNTLQTAYSVHWFFDKHVYLRCFSKVEIIWINFI